MRYAIELTPDDNGTLMVTCPDLPEVTSFGDDEADAMLHAVDGIESAIQGRISDRAEITFPRTRGRTEVEVPALTAMKAALHNEMLAQGLKKADLARLLGWKGPQVDRLFSIGHASRLDQLEQAFRVLGKRIEVAVRNAA